MKTDKVYRPKPLVWEKVGTNEYRAISLDWKFFVWKSSASPSNWPWRCNTNGNRYRTLEAAQAAAQAWRDERLLADLEEVVA